MKAILFLGVVCLTIMFGFTLSGRQSDEVLAVENCQVAVAGLPLDIETFDKAYQTATFGIG